MARGLRWIALLGLAALPAALADVTCVDNASNQATYTSSNGDEFTIMCGVDYAGGDISATITDTFAECIDACSTTTGCIDVSYAAPSCYMKNALNELIEGRSWVWTAKQVLATPPLTCVDNASDQATYTSSNGDSFTIMCGVDYAGGDLSATTTDTFAKCIEACSTTSGCIDVSYAAPSCYMKNVVNELVEGRSWVWTAKQVVAAPPLSCENHASDGLTYHGFTITCGKDYAGGDLMGISTASFEACIEACDANTACVNVAYVYGACYLKGVQMPAVDSTAVWGAVRNAPSAPTGCEITSVIYGVKDVTSYAVTNWQAGDNIEIDTDAIVGNAYPPSADPLYGTPKSIFVLYACGGETRSWVGSESTGSFTLSPGDISLQPSSSMVVPDWLAPNGETWITIVEVAYGLAQNRDTGVWDTIYNSAWNSEELPIVNDLFGDSWYGITKSAVIWYRDNRGGPNGPLRFASGIERSYVALVSPNGGYRKRQLVGRHFRR